MKQIVTAYAPDEGELVAHPLPDGVGVGVGVGLGVEVGLGGFAADTGIAVKEKALSSRIEITRNRRLATTGYLHEQTDHSNLKPGF